MTVSRQFLNAILNRKKEAAGNSVWEERYEGQAPSKPGFADHPELKKLRMLQKAAERFGVKSPFFRVHQGAAGAHTTIGDRELLNFSHYNYLGLNHHPEVNRAAQSAIDIYGTSAGASRVVAGERPVQRELEKTLASIYEADDCVVFVSGHAANVNLISSLFGPRDAVFHDALIHNSVIEGIRASGATRRFFAHNDLESLNSQLASVRHKFDKILIVVEGVYSMDGDVPDLPRLVEIKRKYGAFLMADEAHALGVLGSVGKGLAEYWNVPPQEVDIWMGTLSKTLGGCGGYVAGSQDLVDLLKFTAPGFVYSVGISPPLAAASLKAAQIMQREPERVSKLQENGRIFMEEARRYGMDTRGAMGYAVIPIIVGSSRKAIEFSSRLFEEGINVLPIIHPAVEEKASRLRFFLSSEHEPDEIRGACATLARLLGKKEM